MDSFGRLFASYVPPMIVMRNKRIKSTVWFHTKDVQSVTTRTSSERRSPRRSITIDIHFTNGLMKTFSGGKVICRLANMLNPRYALDEIYDDCAAFEDDWELISSTEEVELRNESHRKRKVKEGMTVEEVVNQLEDDDDRDEEPLTKKIKVEGGN